MSDDSDFEDEIGVRKTNKKNVLSDSEDDPMPRDVQNGQSKDSSDSEDGGSAPSQVSDDSGHSPSIPTSIVTNTEKNTFEILTVGKNKKNSTLGPRKSKLTALDEIHGETQRLVRESQVSLPYHVPKQRTLADFLNRRKAMPTTLLKTHSDEMVKFWKKIEEREKTAESFYGSDSEGESVEEQPKSDSPVEETPEEMSKISLNYICVDTTQSLDYSDMAQSQVETSTVVPKLSGEEDELIDLNEVVPKPTGSKLMKRFMEHASLKPKFQAKEEVLELSVITPEVKDGEVLSVTTEKVRVKSTAPKPTQKRINLKATLQQKMTVEKEQLLAKRIEVYKLNEEETGPDELDKLDYECDVEEEASDGKSVESIAEDVELVEKPRQENPFVEESAEEVEECGDDEDEDSDEEEDSDEDAIDVESVLNKVAEDPSEVGSASGLADLCSGNFTAPLVNVKDLEGSEGESTSDSESDSESNSSRDKSNESDNDSDVDIDAKPKKVVKLQYSDDEDDTIVDDEENKTDEEEITEADISDYYDEEQAQADALAKAFMEGEAELSGSEWGSADEDEKDLDTFEEEEGDKDKISQRKLQKELAKIHMREVLADDQREIRILQEVLLEDGELHSDGPKRQRLFRWSNQDENGVMISKTDEDGEELSDDEDEETWRRERHLRENFLKTKQIDNLDAQLGLKEVNVKTTTVVAPPPQPLTDSPDPKSRLNLITKRGSFLCRGDRVLNKLAELTNCTGDNDRSKYGRMIFSTVSPTKEHPPEEKKRKPERANPAPAKKLCLDTSAAPRGTSILDQLAKSDLN